MRFAQLEACLTRISLWIDAHQLSETSSLSGLCPTILLVSSLASVWERSFPWEEELCCTLKPWSPLSLALQNLGHPKVFSGAYKAMTRWLEEILRRSCCRLKMVWKIFVSVTHLVWKMMVLVGLFPEVPLLFTNSSFTDNPATEVTVQSPFQAESCQSEVLSMCNHQFPTFHTLLLFKMRAGLG